MLKNKLFGGRYATYRDDTKSSFLRCRFLASAYERARLHSAYRKRFSAFLVIEARNGLG